MYAWTASTAEARLVVCLGLWLGGGRLRLGLSLVILLAILRLRLGVWLGRLR